MSASLPPRRLSRTLAGLTVLGALAFGGIPGSWAAEAKKSPASMLPGAGSHDPISIDAGKLDYFDKDQKLIYSGNVVAVQGDSTLKVSQLIIFLSKDDAKPGAAPGGTETAAAAATAAGGAAAAAGSSSVRHMDAKGPVTLVSKDQVGTGDNGSYDKGENKVTLTGNVTLSQGTNVTKGDRLVYDLTSGQAQVFSGQTSGRVQSVFTPGSGGPEIAPAAPAKKKTSKQKGPAGTADAQ